MYKDHPDYGGEVDHKALIERLVAEFPDGWALSTSSKTLGPLVRLCPDDTRILSWVTLNPRFPPGGGLISAWQPCLMKRLRPPKDICLDVLVTSYPVGLFNAFLGGKPEEYCFWLFRCLGALPDDELVDLFPGSGAVGRAWDKYQRQTTLPIPREKTRTLAFDIP